MTETIHKKDATSQQPETFNQVLHPVPFSDPVELVYDAAAEEGNTLPFPPGTLGKLMLTAVTSAEGLAPQEGASISRQNEKHGRSFERTTVVFADKFGNKFRHLSLKGAGPFRLEKSNAASADSLGYTPWGFASNASRQRILSASETLRGIGIDTEYPIAIGRPESFPIVSQDGSVKHMSPTDIYKTIDPDAELEDGHELNVYLRASKTAVRIDDLTLHEKDEGSGEFTEKETERVKGALMQVAEDLASTEPENQFDLDVDDPNSVRDFVLEIIAPRVGVNIAKLHNAGLVHNSLTSGNITALGGIVDLDSITGPALGDKKQLPIDALSDLVLSLQITNIDQKTKDLFQDHIRKGRLSQPSCAETVYRLVESGLMSPPIEENAYGRLEEVPPHAAPEVFADHVLEAYEKESGSEGFAYSALNLLRKSQQKYTDFISDPKNMPL